MALSSGQGLLVMKAVDLRDEGKSVDEIVAAVEEIRTHINTSFIPDSLDYLHKGGRVSGMVKLAAGIFKIHPMIMMDNGQLVPGKKYKGKMSVIIKQYIEDLKEMYPDYDKTRCFVTHSTADAELVEIAKEKVKEVFDFDEVIETVAGSIVTSHCGRNTLGVLFVYNK
jgi:DegV family protein with EDD domain